MAQSKSLPKPPTGLGAFFWRLPIWVFRLKLDFMFFGRLMMIHHVGRKSGKERLAVVEVARKDAATQTYYVCAGFGRESHWYQNLKAHPEATIQVGGRTIPVTATLLDAAASGEEMVRYVSDHPGLARVITRLLGYPNPGSIEGYRQLGEEHLPFVAFKARS